jgi:hypothetical protein
MRCGDGAPKTSEAGEKEWLGRWSCDRVCDKKFDVSSPPPLPPSTRCPTRFLHS